MCDFYANSFFMYLCILVGMYVYSTYYAPKCRANGIKNASFARNVGAKCMHYVFLDIQ